MGKKPEEVGKHAGVKDGSNANIEAAGETTKHSSRLDEEARFMIGYGFGFGGNDIGYSRD